MQDASYKLSNLLYETNKQIILIFFMQIVISFCAALYGQSWAIENLDTGYLSVDKTAPWTTEKAYLII